MANSKYRGENYGQQQGIPLMRVSYAHQLRKGQEQTRDDGTKVQKYGCSLILPKSDTAGLAMLRKMVADAVRGEWGDKGVEQFKGGLIKNPILLGDGKEARSKDTGEIHAGLGPDFVFIRPSSNDPVMVFNKALQPAKDEDIVSGHWGFAVLNCFSWHNPKNGNGVSFGISMFQFVKADDVLGGGKPTDPSKYFETVQTGGGAAGGDASGMFDD